MILDEGLHLCRRIVAKKSLCTRQVKYNVKGVISISKVSLSFVLS